MALGLRCLVAVRHELPMVNFDAEDCSSRHFHTFEITCLRNVTETHAERISLAGKGRDGIPRLLVGGALLITDLVCCERARAS